MNRMEKWKQKSEDINKVPQPPVQILYIPVNKATEVEHTAVAERNGRLAALYQNTKGVLIGKHYVVSDKEPLLSQAFQLY